MGHGLVAIQMQADISRHLQSTRPEQAQVALDAISRTAAEALADLRTALATITPHDTGKAVCEAPTPGLHLLESLGARIEQAGVTVDVTVHGEWRPLPTDIDVAAYRVLQESLTNVVKHSPHPQATVEICYLPDSISVRVTNQDVSGDNNAEGFGISGMRRRVARLGGELSAGNGRPPGRFEVYATIPTCPAPGR